MQDFIFELSDGKKITRKIAAKDKKEALSMALTAISTLFKQHIPSAGTHRDYSVRRE